MVNDTLRQELLGGIREHYNASNDSSGLVLAWAHVQEQLECCGVQKYDDWFNITSWPGRDYVPDSCCFPQHRNITGKIIFIKKNIAENVDIPPSGFGLTGTQPASSAGFTLGGFSQPATTASAGLGGVTTTSLGGGLSTATGSQGKQDAKAIKENTIPNEINQSVEDFKKFVKDQKIKKEEVARGSEKGLEKVSQEIEALRKLLATLASGVQRHASLANKLKYDVALEFQNVEIAQRTKETAASMQIDNVGPLKYFFRLVTSFEENMQAYRQQIDEIERDLTALSRQQSLTPQELTNGLKKIHESLISLASKVYAVHSSLQNFKETYLDFRRRYHGDTTDIFAARKSGSAPMRAAAQIPSTRSAGGLSRTLASLSGSTNQGNISGLMGSSSAGNVSSSTGGGLSLFGGSAGSTGTGFGLLGGNSQTLQSAENRSFQLQSPPPGNKRNKR
nr:EOG090X0D34 [Eulimnadia texana]